MVCLSLRLEERLEPHSIYGRNYKACRFAKETKSEKLFLWVIRALQDHIHKVTSLLFRKDSPDGRRSFMNWEGVRKGKFQSE
jgi:hypothetical protein